MRLKSTLLFGAPFPLRPFCFGMDAEVGESEHVQVGGHKASLVACCLLSLRIEKSQKTIDNEFSSEMTNF